MSQPEQHQLLAAAADALSAAWATDVAFEVIEHLPSPHFLVRAAVESGDAPVHSVVVKHVTTTEFTAAGGGEPSPRGLNELAALEFLDRFELSPRVHAADSRLGLAVFEDLGDLPSVERLLLGTDEHMATRALDALGDTIGRIHAATAGRRSEFESLQRRWKTQAPRSDSTFDVRSAVQKLEEVVATLDVSPGRSFWDEVAAVESSVHSVGAIDVLLHADAGPQNFLWDGSTARLLDFEFATFGNGLLDAVSARLGFPHSANAARLPGDVVERLEDTYRQRVVCALPRLADEAVFASATTDAAAHWAMVRLVGLWDGVWRVALEPDAPEDSTRAAACKQALTVYQGFVDIAQKTALRPVLAEAMEVVVARLMDRIDGLAPPDLFPAFRR